MRFRHDVLALFACIVFVAVVFFFQFRTRNVYEIDGYGLDIGMKELESRLGPLKTRSRGRTDEIWLTFGNTRDTEFLLNQQLKTFAVRGKSLWSNGVEILPARSDESAVIAALGAPEARVPDTGRESSTRVLKYPKFGLEVVMMYRYSGQAPTGYHVSRITLRRPAQ